LFEGSEKLKDDKAKKKEILAAIEKANMYKCTTRGCKHGGKLSAYPPVKKPEDFKEEEFQIKRTSEELYHDGLVCFNTKRTFLDLPLGVGLKVTRVARTGEIN
jgi:hypothetical protein